MSTRTSQLLATAHFLRTTLSAFIKEEKLNSSLEKPDWRLLQGIVRARNLGSLFFYCHDGTPLPPPLVQEWQQMKLATSLQNLARLKVATDLTAIAEKAGVKAIAMRGIVLAHTIYPNPAMRPMHDIDFLISPDDRHEFHRAMEAAGHIPTDYFRSQYVYTINDIKVEVHWQLLSNKRYRKKIDSDSLVASAVGVDTTNGHYYRLDDQWEIIGLVLHAFTHHNLGQLFSLIDIGLYMQNKEIAWEDIASWSSKTGISRMMHLTFAFINHLFGLGLEKKVLHHFAPENKRPEKYYQAYLDQTLTRITLSTHLAIKGSQFYVAETYGNKAREVMRLFSPKERRFLVELVAAAISRKKQRLGG